MQSWVRISLIAALAAGSTPVFAESFLIELHATEHEPTANGVLLYEINGEDRRLVVEAGGIEVATGLLVYVNGDFVDDIAVMEGQARLELDTTMGQMVPEVSPESLVHVRATGTEAIVLTSEEPPGFEVYIDLHLFGTVNDPEAHGVAVYRAEGDERRLVVEAGGITAAESVDIFVDGVFAGYVPVVEGTIRLALDTREEDAVPEVTEESLIEVIKNDSELVLLTSVEPVHEGEGEGQGEGAGEGQGEGVGEGAGEGVGEGQGEGVGEGEGEGETEFVIRLFGTGADPDAFGEGFYIRTATFARLLIEVANISSAEGILFYVNGEFVEDLEVIEGTARLNLDTRDGQTVPEMNEHSLIEVVAAGTETVILRSNGEMEDDEIGCNRHGFVEAGATIIFIAPNGTNYQWRKNGVLIAGATSKIIVFDSVQVSDSGTYTVQYDNGAAKAIVISQPYTLTIVAPGSLPALNLVALIVLAILVSVAGRRILARRRL